MGLTIVVVTFCSAVAFLWYVRQREDQNMSGQLVRAVAVSKYIVAVFVATFGSNAFAALLASPLLLYARFSHREAALNLFSVLIDRPYFPFQVVTAFAAGIISWKWLKEGKPTLVWVLPLIEFMVALVIVPSRQSVLNSPWQQIWVIYFDWGCGCSASLLQWEVMFPLYTSTAFSIAAYVRRAASSAPPVRSSSVTVIE